MTAAGVHGTPSAPTLAGARVEWPGIIPAYRDRLPRVADAWEVVTLREGGTPLLPAPHLSELTGCEVHLKIEGANPTGSFKDRGMTVAMTEALAGGAKAVICASTGNTSASAAAYAARAGMTCAVLVPQGKIALGKLAQATAHGARILQLEGNFDTCLELARRAADAYPIALVNSVNPARIEGQKTAVVRDLRPARPRARPARAARSATPATSPPTGAATPSTPATASWPAPRGCSACRPRAPRRWCPARPSPTRRRWPPPSASARPPRGTGPIAARDESGGEIAAVDDEAILDAYRLLAAREGVFVEPASAASVAGLLAKARAGRLDARRAGRRAR